jgi:hypothetical protein
MGGPLQALVASDIHGLAATCNTQPPLLNSRHHEPKPTLLIAARLLLISLKCPMRL